MIKDISLEWSTIEFEKSFSTSDLIINNWEVNLTQEEVIEKIKKFIESQDKNIFILTWWAWTWKTQIIKEIYYFLLNKQKDFKITAPTWKAVYNLSLRIKDNKWDNISTIYSELYEKNDIVDIHHKDVIIFHPKKLDREIYVIDEAWLIWLKIHKDQNLYQQNILNFWTWSVLKDIIENLWVKTKIIFVWDLYQLLPIWDNKLFSLDNFFYESLNNENLRKIYLEQNKINDYFDIKTNSYFQIDTINLTKNYRQENWSWIAKNAEKIKNWIINKEYSSLIEENNETHIINDESLFIEKLKVLHKNKEDSIVIAYENKKVNWYNKIIRDEILFYKDIIEIWDKLIVSKNIKINDELFFNWEQIEVIGINWGIEFHGDIFVWDKLICLKFLDVVIKKSYWDEDKIFNLKLCLNSLYSGENGSWEDVNIWKFISNLFHHKMKKEWWKDRQINKKRYFYKSSEAKENQEYLEQENQEYLNIKNQDKYYNSLHANYWYAITCHKAQWSEWNNVFLDLDSYSQWKTNEGFLRFLYTWITRARNKVYILNNDKLLIDEFKKYDDVALNFWIEKLFIKNYINKIQNILKKYDYFIVWIQEYNYQIQITFTNWQNDWKIWFYYNWKNKFTTKQSISDTWFNQTIIQILIDNEV